MPSSPGDVPVSEVIRVSRTGGLVSVRLTTTGRVSWRHVYVTEERPPFVGKGTDSGPRLYELGTPDDLDVDQQSWLFRVANVTETPQRYSVQIAWVQGGTIAHEWARNGRLEPDEHLAEPDDGIVLAVAGRKRE
jgi:hypothetical protein